MYVAIPLGIFLTKGKCYFVSYVESIILLIYMLIAFTFGFNYALTVGWAHSSMYKDSHSNMQSNRFHFTISTQQTINATSSSIKQCTQHIHTARTKFPHYCTTTLRSALTLFLAQLKTYVYPASIYIP